MSVAPAVFDNLVGQDEAVTVLARAAHAAAAVIEGSPGPGMTHAWLFTGPPGAGRSMAARAFASALQCAEGGCGQCQACRTVMIGTHADVRRVTSEGLSIGVGEIRDLVLRAASSPTQGRWQVVLVEDADRLTEAASNALLKAIEEPPARTVFILCAPSASPEDISVTIRSRCRTVPLVQPSASTVARALVTEGTDSATAMWAASAAQGHLGRARALANGGQAREWRASVLSVPRSLTGIGACFEAANTLIEASDAEASAVSSDLDAKERAALEMALGAGGTGRGAAGAFRGAAGQIKDLERRQKSRSTRVKRDSLDRALVDLAAFYRDALLSALNATVDPIHSDMAEVSLQAGQRWGAESALRRLQAVLECRRAIDRNVKPRIAVEAMMLTLWRG